MNDIGSNSYSITSFLHTLCNSSFTSRRNIEPYVIRSTERIIKYAKSVTQLPLNTDAISIVLCNITLYRESLNNLRLYNNNNNYYYYYYCNVRNID